MKFFLVILFSCLTYSVLCQTVYFDWVKPIQGPDNLKATIIKKDVSNNLVVVGDLKGTADFDPGPSTLNLNSVMITTFISKYDQQGNLLWAKSLQAAGSNFVRGMDLDDQGNIFIIGEMLDSVDFDPGPTDYWLKKIGFRDFFVAKYDSAGHFVWAHSFNAATNIAEGVDLAVDRFGNVLVTGRFRDSVDFDPSSNKAFVRSVDYYDIFIAKYDNNGSYRWAKNFGGSLFGEGKSIDTDQWGNVIISGEYVQTFDFDPAPISTYNLTANFGTASFVTKLDSSGNFVWARTTQSFSFVPAATSIKGDMTVDPEGNIYTTGSFRGTTNFDPGVTNDTAGVAGRNIFVQKISNTGQHLWVRHFNGTGISEGQAITADEAGNVFIGGHIYGTVDFDPSASTFLLTSHGNGDAFVSKLDDAGNLVWAKNYGGLNDDAISSIALGSTNEVYTSGSFQTTADFDPDNGVYQITVAGKRDGYIHKLKNASVGIIEKNLVKVEIAPNPTMGLFYIHLPREYNQLNVKVINYNGQVILRESHKNTSRLKIDLNTSPGLYFVEVLLPDNQKAYAKVLKE